jgi:hypothetical protein
MSSGLPKPSEQGQPVDIAAAIDRAGVELQPAPAEPLPSSLEVLDIGPPGGPAQYEFTPQEEHLIADLGRKMRFVGVMLIVLGIVFGLALPFWSLLRGLKFEPEDLGSVLGSVIGFFVLSAGIAFRDVAQTQGRDITHLMDALSHLRKSFTIATWLLVLMFLIAVAVLAARFTQGTGPFEFWFGGRHIIIK